VQYLGISVRIPRSIPAAHLQQQKYVFSRFGILTFLGIFLYAKVIALWRFEDYFFTKIVESNDFSADIHKKTLPLQNKYLTYNNHKKLYGKDRRKLGEGSCRRV
jgi:hypothetical protein